MVASYHPLEVFPGWVSKLGIESPSNFCALDQSMSVTCLVSRDSVDEFKVFIARFILMQPTFVHSELHIWFSLHFLVEYEHLVLPIMGDPIFLYDVYQSNDVGD